MSRKYKYANKFLVRFCLNYLLKKSKELKIKGYSRQLVKQDLRYLFYKFGLHEYYKEK